MDESLYDEFGNYIGPELASDQVMIWATGALWRSFTDSI